MTMTFFCAKVVHFACFIYFPHISAQVAAFEAICGKASMDGSVVNFLKAHRHMTDSPRSKNKVDSVAASGLGGEQACTPSFAHD